MLSSKNPKTLTSISWFTLFIAIFIIFSQSHAKETQPIEKHIYSNQFLNAVQQWRDYLAEPQDCHVKWSLGLVISGVSCFLAATISSAGGIGGGGLYLPILTIVTGLSLKTASSFSAFMVTGGSIANVVYYLYTSCGTKAGNKALIDYDVAIAILSQPCMLLGVSIGVICNDMFPEWLITALFAVFLAWTTTRTCRRGVFYWKKETDQARIKGLESRLTGDASEQAKSLKEPILAVEIDSTCSLGIPWLKLGILSIIWISFFVLYLLRGNKSGQSLSMEKWSISGLGYWILTSLQIPLAFIFTSWILLRRRNQNPHLEDAGAAIAEDASSMLLFPILAFSAGYLGGVFGIGGGMLISPLLLQTGMAPEVTAATCSFMVFFSSSMSAFQYLFLGMDNVNVVIILATICFMASVLGLVAVQKAIQQYGKASLIVFSVSTVMALSTVLITSFGALDVYEAYISGQPMGFNLPC